MRTLALLVAVILLFPIALYAGNIYGTLWVGGRPVGPGAQVAVTCGAISHPPVGTDGSGGYRIFVREKGRCNFNVHFGNRSYQAEIASYDAAIKYDFDLIPNGTLRRR